METVTFLAIFCHFFYFFIDIPRNAWYNKDNQRGATAQEEKTMTNTFKARVMKELTVDTRTYRYNVKDCGDHAEIQRIPLKYLNTTAAYDGWETVAVID